MSQAAKEVLQLPPKTSIFPRITLKDIEVEVVKAVEVKARWELMGREERERSGQTRQEALEEERMETQVHNKQAGIPRYTVWKCFGCQMTCLGHPRGSEGAKKGPKNENCHILAVSTPETASGAVVIKT